MNRRPFVPALALALTAAHTLCTAQTVLTTPRAFPIVIDQPGTYALGGPLNAPAQTHAIKITASNVVLDLRGHTIKGGGICTATWCPGPGLASGVWIGGSNVTVRNGTVVGFDMAGVFFDNRVVTLEDLTLTDNYRAGVVRHSPPAQPGANTLPATLRRITATRNGQAGVWGYGMRIEQAHLVQNFGSGLVSQGFNTIYDTLFMQNKAYGYDNGGTIANDDAVRGSRFQGNGLKAVQVLPPGSMGGNFDDSTDKQF